MALVRPPPPVLEQTPATTLNCRTSPPAWSADVCCESPFGGVASSVAPPRCAARAPQI